MLNLVLLSIIPLRLACAEDPVPKPHIRTAGKAGYFGQFMLQLRQREIHLLALPRKHENFVF